MKEFYQGRLLFNWYLISFCVFLTILLIYPHIFLINWLEPQRNILGKNAYIVLITGLIAILFLLNWIKLRYLLSRYAYFALILPALILLLRMYFYHEITLTEIISARSIFMIPIYLLVAKYFTDSVFKKNLVSTIIIITALVHAIFGLFHHYYYMFIEIGTHGTQTLIGSRESGMLISSNCYANFILLGMLLLTNLSKDIFIQKYFTWRCITLFIMFWGILLSVSRLSCCFAAFTIFVFIKNNFSTRKSWLLPFGMIFLMGYVFHDIIGQVLNRLMMEGVGREKNIIVMHMLFSHFQYMLLGIPQYIVSHTYDIAGHAFSDNSYMSLILNYGVVAFSVWFIAMVGLVNKTIVWRQCKYMLSYLLVILYFTNAILWDFWMLFYFLTLYCAQQSIASPEKAYEQPRPHKIGINDRKT